MPDQSTNRRAAFEAAVAIVEVCGPGWDYDELTDRDCGALLQHAKAIVEALEGK